jgi:hypothetical protein
MSCLNLPHLRFLLSLKPGKCRLPLPIKRRQLLLPNIRICLQLLLMCTFSENVLVPKDVCLDVANYGHHLLIETVLKDIAEVLCKVLQPFLDD